MLLVAAMLAMPIGCGKDGNKDKDTTSGVETTDIGDDSAETDAPSKTPVPKNQIKTRIPRTKQISRTMIMNRHRLRKKNMKVCLLRI